MDTAPSIVQEILHDREAGAARLVAECREPLYAAAFSLCGDPAMAEDLVFRTFERVLDRIATCRDESAFTAWMKTILRNEWLMSVRGATVRNTFPAGSANEIESLAEPGDDSSAVAKAVDASLLRDAIEELPEDMREAVVLRYFLGLPLLKAAKILSVPVGTLNSRLHYARQMLAAKLNVAAKKPSVKALLIALALAALTAIGAAVMTTMGSGGNQSTAIGGDQELSTAIGSRLQSAADDNRLQSNAGSRQPTATGDRQETYDLRLTTFDEQSTAQGEDMNLRNTAAAVFATALAVQTAIPTAASGAELHLTASDNSSSYGNTSFNIWNKAGGGTEAPNSANDYVVDGGYSMRFPNGSYPSGGWVWPGNSLRIGTVGSSEGVLVVTRTANSTHTFNNGGLILAKGRIQPWVGNYTQTFTGKITVTAPESAPFDVMLSDTSSHPNQTFTIGGTLIGEAGTALRVYANTANYPAKFNFTPTTPTDFFGTIIVGRGDASKTITCSTDNNKAMPGGFKVTTGSKLTSLQGGKSWTIGFMELQSGASFLPVDASTKWTVGDLSLGTGSTISMRVNGSNISTITVANSISVAPGAILNFNGAPTAGDTNAMEWVILTLPQDKGAIPLGNFTLSGLASFPGELPRYSLATNAVDGKWRLLLKKRAHDYLAVNDDSGWDITQALPSALTTASSWANGEVPHAGVDYAAENGKGGLTAYPIVRTPYQREPFVFAGDSLTLASGSRLMLCGSDTTFPILALGANTLIPLAMAGSPSHFRGKIHTFGGSDTYPQRLQAYFNGLNTVEAEVSGGGTIHVLSRQSSSRPYGDMEFTGLNTNFTGKIRVCAESTDDANTIPTAENLRHERLFVTDARNLGGPLNAFRADALELADYSVLEARNDVDFNVANRGVKVSGNAGFAAPENVTLAISNDITWNGTARKTGAGTLALGGAPRIDAGATAALIVEQGFLQIRFTNAVNGVSVSFEDGAYLLVDPAATGDIAAYGAVDLSAHPFGGALAVAFDYPGGAPEGEQTATVAVATVADAAKAQSLDFSARKMRGYSVKFPTRANADGTVTILARCFKPAFIMVVR